MEIEIDPIDDIWPQKARDLAELIINKPKIKKDKKLHRHIWKAIAYKLKHARKSKGYKRKIIDSYPELKGMSINKVMNFIHIYETMVIKVK